MFKDIINTCSNSEITIELGIFLIALTKVSNIIVLNNMFKSFLKKQTFFKLDVFPSQLTYQQLLNYHF